jgi:hypothetical protein
LGEKELGKKELGKKEIGEKGIRHRGGKNGKLRKVPVESNPEQLCEIS